MAIIWNPTKETVHTKMQGSWFTFKPDSRKRMEEDKARFITENRKETGLVVLPASFEMEDGAFNTELANTPEGKQVLEAKRQEGVSNLIAFHKDIVRNNQISFRRDMAKVNPEGDSAKLALLEMSEGERKSLEIVSKYQKEKNDAADQRVKELQQLLDEAGPLGE